MATKVLNWIPSKKSFMLLLKMSLVLKLKVTNANSNMITFLNIVLFDIKKSMMKKKINDFCDSIGLDRKKMLLESFPEIIFTSKTTKL